VVRVTTAQVLAELAVVARLGGVRFMGGIASPPYGTQGVVCARQSGAHAHPP
jgi:hypothetical protein